MIAKINKHEPIKYDTRDKTCVPFHKIHFKGLLRAAKLELYLQQYCSRHVYAQLNLFHAFARQLVVTKELVEK